MNVLEYERGVMQGRKPVKPGTIQLRGCSKFSKVGVPLQVGLGRSLMRVNAQVGKKLLGPAWGLVQNRVGSLRH